ncbi:hypothetical protein CFIMG_004509RAa [Ceratocystis fimbriata CBS 114723]|uniref:Uncharacterized protein n=1 Tax=Ceratocystis fimbriata CBS 114723 TaxID=1035309 RepID=A0A2C5WXY8_9PEZI|nr:hypothetical protein CFIMG_004509RAa [Ceratocystis fimbriata CBS 114723]
MKRKDAKMERTRAVDVVKEIILRKVKQQAADARVYEIEADARTDRDNESSGSANGPGIDTIRNVYQMLPPLMAAINE